MSFVARFAAPVALLLACTLPAAAQQKDKEYEPQVGQAGKDVIWVPTPDEVVQRMLRMAQVTANDYVVDLGAGDGKIAIAAAKTMGARSLGIEYNPDMAKHAQRNAEKAGVTGKAKIIQGDIFASDFTTATVITMYLLPALNMKLRPQILAMKPGTRVVSHSFNMEDWEPDETSNMDGRRAYLWIVPANVMGSWQVEMGGERADLTLEQKFQKLDGHVQLGVIQAGLREARLRGFLISFAYVDNTGMRRDFTGRVTGTKMEGSFRSDTGAEGRWTASKK
ncbi:MAG TPA: class I SAM-dependent methyltransferase [Burkholderiales bacterium]|jgi:SAM-dependent methyltransferase|nr:class I SAM-dependent methyltransferase [Burkholderiales bacterium]